MEMDVCWFPPTIDFDRLSGPEGEDNLADLPFIGDQIQAEMDAKNGGAPIQQQEWQKDFEPVNALLKSKYGEDFSLPERHPKENYYEKLLEKL